MKALRLMGCVLALTVIGVVQAQDTKGGVLVGNWEVVKGSPGTMNPGDTMEFTKDGKMKIMNARSGEMLTGTYTLTGKNLTLTVGKDGMEFKQGLVVKTLTATELVIAEEKNEDKSVQLKPKK